MAGVTELAAGLYTEDNYWRKPSYVNNRYEHKQQTQYLQILSQSQLTLTTQGNGLYKIENTNTLLIVDLNTLTVDLNTLIVDLNTLIVHLNTLIVDLNTLIVDLNTLIVDLNTLIVDLNTLIVDLNTSSYQLPSSSTPPASNTH